MAVPNPPLNSDVRCKEMQLAKKFPFLTCFLVMTAFADEVPINLTVVGAKNHDLSASFYLTVLESGEIMQILVKRSSGTPEFDASVIRTLQAASPISSSLRINGLDYEKANNRFILPSW